MRTGTAFMYVDGSNEAEYRWKGANLCRQSSGQLGLHDAAMQLDGQLPTLHEATICLALQA